MARLSVEHYRSNPGTPRPERKPNRLREIFKQRPSMSASSSPSLLTKPQTGTSPTGSPVFKPGFEKIGLLPSERPSTELTVSGTIGGPKGQTRVKILKQISACASSVARDNSEAVANDGSDATVEAQTPGLDIRETIVNMPSSSGAGKVKYSGIDHGPSSPPPWEQDVTKDGINNSTKLRKLPHSSNIKQLERILKLFADREKSTDDLSGCHQAPASNMFDDDDAPSQGIREYVKSMIVTAFSQHRAQIACKERSLAKLPMSFSLNINVPADFQRLLWNGISGLSGIIGISSHPELVSLPQKLGPVIIGNARMVRIVQNAILVIICIVALEAALSGPKDLLLALWRICVVLGVYAIVVRKLGWSLSFEQDLLLSQAVYAIQEVQLVCKDLMADSSHHAAPEVIAETKGPEQG